MPWCPKCGSEYGPECVECADCGASLTDNNSTRVDTPSPGGRFVIEIGLISALGPWVWYFLTALLASIFYVPVNTSRTPVVAYVTMLLTVCIPVVVVLQAAFIYGRRRRMSATHAIWPRSLLATLIFQVLLCLTAGVFVPKPWKLILMGPLYALVSIIVLVVVWIGRVAAQAASR